MKILIIISILLGCNSSQAAILLVPTRDISPAVYFDWCYRENYGCTTDVFVNDIKNKEAILFNQLMDQVDLSSKEYSEKFRNSIIHILNTEDLDLTQLEMLLALLNQLNKAQPSLLFKMIENELIRTRNIVLSGIEPEKSEFVLIFKKSIALEVAQKIKTTVLKIPIYLISYSDIPLKSDSASFNRIARKPLVTGTCENFKVNLQIKENNWILLKPSSCKKQYSEQATEPSDFSFTKEARY